MTRHRRFSAGWLSLLLIATGLSAQGGVQTKGYGQFHYLHSNQNDRSEFFVRRLIWGGSGFVDESAKLVVFLEASKTVRLFCAYGDMTLSDEFNLIIGQFKPSFGLEGVNSASRLDFTEHSRITKTAVLSLGDSVGSVFRDVGVQVRYQHALSDETSFEATLAIVNGNGPGFFSGKRDNNADKDWLCQFKYQYRDGVVAVSGLRSVSTGYHDAHSNERTGVAMGWFHSDGPVHVRTEWMYIDQESLHPLWGYYIGTIVPVAERWALTARLDQVISDGFSEDGLLVGVNWQTSMKTRLMMNIEHLVSESRETRITLQFQVKI